MLLLEKVYPEEDSLRKTELENLHIWMYREEMLHFTCGNVVVIAVFFSFQRHIFGCGK